MKRTIFLLSVLMSLAASAQEVKPSSKFGIDLQQHLYQNVNHSNVLTRGAAPKVKVLVSLVPTAGVTSADLEAVGCEVKWAMKSVASVTIAVDQLEALAAIPGVRNINLPRMGERLNDEARKAVYVDDVADPKTAVAAGLPKEYDGTGVLVGIIDGGIDFRHVAFTDEEGKTRIQRAFTQKMTADGEFDSFEAYTTPDEIIKAVPQTDDTHGSHVLGTMTGRELGNNLHGMAPKADIVAVDCGLSEDQFIEAMKLICEYAENVKKPIAINMSLGTSRGCPDGWNPVSDAMMELTDNGTKPGVIFSVASANYGNGHNYVHHTFTSDDEKLFLFCDTTAQKPFEFEGHLVRAINNPETVMAWTDHLVDNKEEMLAIFDLEKKKMIEDPDAEIGVASLYPKVENGDTIFHFADPTETLVQVKRVITLRQLREILKQDKMYLSSVLTCSDGVSKKNEMSFTVDGYQLRLFKNYYLGTCFSYPAGTEILVANFGGSGNGKRFIKLDGFDNTKVSTSDGTINRYACNIANITTGNYCTKNKYTNYFEHERVFKEVLHDVVEDSSYGITFNEQRLHKPEILAPGTYIASAANNYWKSEFHEYGVLSDNMFDQQKVDSKFSSKVTVDGQDYWYVYLSGTSMAAPVTTGVIALWLQANPNLSVADVREIIAHASTPFKSTNPAYEGEELRSSEYGIINALEGLKYIQANMTSISTLSQDDQNDGDARIFTLDGKEVKGIPAPGFYVQGGKKVVITK